MALKRLFVSQKYAIGAAELFAYLSVHQNTTHLYPLAKVSLLQSGQGHTHGLGSIRKIQLPLLPFFLQEQITAYQPNRRIEYQMIGCSSPFTHHKGVIVFTDLANGGSQIDYTVDLDCKMPLTNDLMHYALTLLIRRALQRLGTLAALN